jgi:phenylalanyl-tRNA synthetase alpha chain
MGVAQRLDEIEHSALEAIAGAADVAQLEAARVAWLGKKSELTGLLRSVGSASPEERPVIGKRGNQVREAIEAALARRKDQIEAGAVAAAAEEPVDATLPGRRRPRGHRHLVTRTVEDIVDIFVGLGYDVADGPEVETDYYNFTALNTPPDHPSRALTDTFYVRGERDDLLLRTHTSPVQIRVMEATKPPIYVLMPGRVFRRDVADPSHTPAFHQIEGLVVDEGITFGDLKGTLEHAVSEIFGPERKTRFRPHFFPFTEPSAEVDVSCGICEGSGCRFCKHSGWIEILGSGMVDPNVFEMVGIDPEKYSGFAFGMGPNRIADLKHGIGDIRLLFENDLRFLRQFR